MRTVNAAPKASTFVESMRDIGYSLETALADIIDNSIAAHASTIRLFADAYDSEARIGILDDGDGMTEGELVDAMRPGSCSPLDERDVSDLGRFGLGLKIASFSQCRRLTVASRRSGVLSVAIWDLDFVAESNDWLVQVPDDIRGIPWISEIPMSGTLVIWENLDRLIERVDPEKALASFVARVDDAREHLELVFHRYLTGERPLRKIRIYLNNRQLEPFDPFHSQHLATLLGPIERIRVGHHDVVVQAYTLPHHSKVTPAEWDRLAGRAGYLKNQGFYLYREKRLIIHGTWFGLARQTELTKLARVRIDMRNDLDARWKIDIKKSSADPPVQVRDRLKKIIETIGAGSKRIYRHRGRTLASVDNLPVWNRIQNKNDVTYRLNADHPVVADFVSKLPANLVRDFGHILELLSASLPVDALFADMAGDPTRVSGNPTTDEGLQHAVHITFQRLVMAGAPLGSIPEMLRMAEPFRSSWQRTIEILELMTSKEKLSDEQPA